MQYFNIQKAFNSYKTQMHRFFPWPNSIINRVQNLIIHNCDIMFNQLQTIVKTIIYIFVPKN